MPEMESSMVPMTKQLNSVTFRAVPAPAWMRPPGKELKVLQDAEELLFPSGGVLRLDGGQRMGDAAPGVDDGALGMAAVGVPIFGFPDVMRNIGCEVAHRASSSKSLIWPTGAPGF